MNFKKNIFFKNVSILFLGTLISQIINIGGLPILSRLYGTTEFSTLALFMALGLIVLSFSSFQLDYAIVKHKFLEEKLALIGLAFSSVILIAIIVTSGLLVWSNWSNKIDTLFILTLFIFFIANGGNQILVYFFNSEKKYKNIAFARVLLALVNIVFAITLFYIWSKIGLIVALTIANVFSFGCLLIFFQKKIKRIFQIRSTIFSKVLKQNIKFIQFSTPAAFLDILSHQAIFFFLVGYFSEEITASFFMAVRIVLLPAGLVGYAISQVFYKDISDKFIKNTLTKFDFWKIWKLLFLLGVIPFTILFFFGKELFVFILGENWGLAGEMAVILALKGFVNFCSSPTSSGFVVMNKQQYNLILNIIRLGYTFFLLYLSIIRNDIFFFLWWYTFAEIMQMMLYNFLILRQIPAPQEGR